MHECHVTIASGDRDGPLMFKRRKSDRTKDEEQQGNEFWHSSGHVDPAGVIGEHCLDTSKIPSITPPLGHRSRLHKEEGCHPLPSREVLE